MEKWVCRQVNLPAAMQRTGGSEPGFGQSGRILSTDHAAWEEEGPVLFLFAVSSLTFHSYLPFPPAEECASVRRLAMLSCSTFLSHHCASPRPLLHLASDLQPCPVPFQTPASKSLFLQTVWEVQFQDHLCSEPFSMCSLVEESYI